MRRIVIKDTILELWRGNISYVIFIIMALGLIQSISATYLIKNQTWFQEIEIINIKKYSYLGSLFLFSFIWKGIIISILGAFTFSKYFFSTKLSFLFFSLNRLTYLVYRMLGLIIFLSIFFIFWDVVLAFSVAPLKILSIKDTLFFSFIGDIILFAFLSIPLFLGLYFSPTSTSFLSLVLFLIGDAHLLLTPFTGIQIPPKLENLLRQFPDVISLVMFLPSKYLNIPYGVLDIYPNIKFLLIYICQSLIFLTLFLICHKKIEL